MTSTVPVMLMAAAMMAVGVGFVTYLVRSNASGRPEGVLQWGATVLATLLVATSGVLLVLSVVIYRGGGQGTGSPRVAVPAEPSEADGLGQPAPDLAFRALGGEEGARRSLEAYRGEVVLLNFWATWCAPCLHELPDLERLQADLADEGLTVLALSDEPPETLRRFLDERPLELPVGYLPDRADVPEPFAGTLVIRPVTYVVDRDGVVRDVVRGARDYDFFREAVTPYL